MTVATAYDEAKLRPAVPDGPERHLHGDWSIPNGECPYLKLWRIQITEADWDYDRFDSAVVWAHDADEAEAIMRAEHHYDEETVMGFSPAMRDQVRAELWIHPDWTLEVAPAPTHGVALVHWHAG